jgi:hypothetical protein
MLGKTFYRKTPRHTIWLLLCCCACLSLGCASTQFLSVRRSPKSPLAGPLQLFSYQGPQPSDRTQQILRRYALRDVQEENPALVLQRLNEELNREPAPEKVYSFAELSFIAAKRAENGGHDGEAIDHYAAAVANAYWYLFSPGFDRVRNPYDPQFRSVCDLYNGSLEGALRIAKKRSTLKPGQSQIITTGKQKYQMNIVVRGPWRAEDIERLEFVSDFEIEGGLKNQYHTYGLGVPLIAVRKPQSNPQNPATKYYPPGLSFATTAFLRVMPPAEHQSQTEVRQCVLELHDPLASNDIMVNGRVTPLETDLTVPLGYFLDSPEFKERDISTLGLLNPDKTQGLKGLFMLEPYDPQRIPVVMVHGLWSSPITWMEMFNDLRAYPEIREKYQFWFFLYPTGQPFWESSAQLRETLAEVQRDLNPHQNNLAFNQMVLVGHSMGGLVSYMQSLESGEDFWRVLSDKSFQELKGDAATREKLARMVYFHPNPAVKCVVTIGTPHHGSDFATDTARWAGRALITLPEMMVQFTNTVARENPGLFRDTALLTTSTSIDSLSPSSPIFQALNRAQRAPGVAYYNVIGLLPESFTNSFSGKGDGVVAYKNAQLADAKEITVTSDHVSVHRNPECTLHVRRILLEHWQRAALPLAMQAPQEIRLVSGEEEISDE